MNSGQIQLVTHQSPKRQYRVDYWPISPLRTVFQIMEPETYLGEGSWGGGGYLNGTSPLSRILAANVHPEFEKNGKIWRRGKFVQIILNYRILGFSVTW